MIRLTREVRFSLPAPGSEASRPGPGTTIHNGFAGHPPASPEGHPGLFLALALTLEGRLDPASQYLVNIKAVDDAVRGRVIPGWEAAFTSARSASAPLPTYPTLLRAAYGDLAAAFSPVRLTRLDLRTCPFQTFTLVTSEPSMPLRLSHQYEFSAAHRLHNPNLSDDDNRSTFGKCNNPLGHGHNYVVQVTVNMEPAGSPSLRHLDAVVDEHLIRIYDHKHLNLEVEEFRTTIPSVENIARAAYLRLKPHLPHLHGVTVWETPKTWAEYSE